MMRLAAFALAAATVAASKGRAAGPEAAVIVPGQAWVDTNGNRIYAGGANIFEEDGTFYLIGEGEKVYQDLSQCFNLYRSTDLQNWDFVGCALNNSDIVAPPPYNNEAWYRMERPKLMSCGGRYVLWFHCDTSDFSMKSVGVLTAGAVTGPYTFAAPCFQPDGMDSYDMGTFVDTAAAGGDGRGYLIRSVYNQYAGISQMTEDCLNVTGVVSKGPNMEGQALMRDSDGVLHAAGSHLTGWDPNPAQFVTTTSPTLANAQWVNNTNPSGDATTFNSQSTFIFPYTHPDGHKTFIWMADRWNYGGPGSLDNATLIWLPLLPPAAVPPEPVPASGWTLRLEACDPSDPLQNFTLTGTAVLHGSGLCVAQAAGHDANQGLLFLRPCSSGAASQTWIPGPSGSIANVQGGTGAGCVSFNNANTFITAGNPIVSWGCGDSPAWNAQWDAPQVGVSGLLQARDSSGADSGMCASVGPLGSPGAWTLPWLDYWTLGEF